MAQYSTSMTDDSNTGNDFLSMIKKSGAQALASGQVSPQDAMASAQSLGLSSPGGPAPAPAVAPVPAPLMTPGGFMNAPKVMSKSTKDTKNTTTKTDKTATTQSTFANQDQFGDLTNMLRGMPEYQDQQDAIGKEQNMLNMMSGVHVNDNSWVDPISRWVDSTTGSHLTAPPNPNQLTQKQLNDELLKYQDDITKRRGDMSKSLIDGITKLKTGSQTTDQNLTNQLSQAIGQMNGMNLGNANDKNSQAKQNANIMRGGKDYDAQMKPYVGVSNSLDRASSLLNGDVPVTSRTFALAANDFINAVSSGGAATEGKVNREMPESLGLKMQQFQENLGKIPNYAQTADGKVQIAQMMAQIKHVQNDYNDAGRRTLEEIKPTYQFIDDPNMQAMIAAKEAQYQKRFMSNPTRVYNAPSAQPASGSKGPKIGDIEDGHKFLGGNPADPKSWGKI